MPTCPKCQGGTFLSEEELVQVLESTDPVQVLVKATYQCMSCSERFVRIVCDNLSARKKPAEQGAPVYYSSQPARPAPVRPEDPAEGLKFF